MKDKKKKEKVIEVEVMVGRDKRMAQMAEKMKKGKKKAKC